MADGCHDGLRAAHALQDCGGIFTFCVDIEVRTQHQGVCADVGAAPHGDDLETHLARVLKGQVPETADPKHRYGIAGLSPRLLERVEGSDTRAEDWRGLL